MNIQQMVGTSQGYINELFNPSDYLVSPFNSTEKFINGNYFLTVQQENIFHDIQKKLQDSTTNFIALTGSAGTGKTLLTYHIAKHYMHMGKRVLVFIVHNLTMDIMY